MVELLQAAYRHYIRYKTSVCKVLVRENDLLDSAVDQSHGAHEARLDIGEQHQLLEVVLVIPFSLVSLLRLSPCLLSEQHYGVVNYASLCGPISLGNWLL